MNNPYFLALDYGTQSVRALVFDSHGCLIAKSQLAVEAYRTGPDLSAEQDPQYCYQQLVKVIRQLLSQSQVNADEISSVSLTTQRACTLLFDRDFQPLTPVYMWSDRRLASASNLAPMSWYYRLAFRLVGMSQRILYLRRAAKVNYLAQYHSDIMARTAKVGLLSSFLLHKISGQALDSTASQVGYLPFDYQRQCWSAERSWRWQALACRAEQMLPLVVSAAAIGPLSASFAADTGLKRNTLVVSAGADKACEVYATGSGMPHIVNVSLGSAATISIGLTEYRETFRYMPAFPGLEKGTYLNEIQLERGFWLLTWLIDQFGEQDKRDAQDLGMGAEDYICHKIQHIEPGCGGLLLSPTWAQGVIYPGPESKGAIVGFTPEHTRFHLYRAAIEGILFTLCSGMERLQRLTKQPFEVARLSGGGAQSKIILQMAADIFGLPVEIIHTNEASALGAAMCSAVGVGIYDTLPQARAAMTQVSQRIEPCAKAQINYQMIKEIHGKLYPQMAPLLSELSQFIK